MLSSEQLEVDKGKLKDRLPNICKHIVGHTAFSGLAKTQFSSSKPNKEGMY